MNSTISDNTLRLLISRALLATGLSLKIADSDVENWQFNSIKSAITSQFTLVSAPTARGKTLIYQLLPFIISDLYNQPCFVLIIAPTISLIGDQRSRVGGVNSAKLTASLLPEITEQIKSGKLKYGNNVHHIHLLSAVLYMLQILPHNNLFIRK